MWNKIKQYIIDWWVGIECPRCQGQCTRKEMASSGICKWCNLYDLDSMGMLTDEEQGLTYNA